MDKGGRLSGTVKSRNFTPRVNYEKLSEKSVAFCTSYILVKAHFPVVCYIPVLKVVAITLWTVSW